MNQTRTARDRLDRVIHIAPRTRRFFWPAMVVVILGTVGSLAYAMRAPRVYKSETLILYREGIRSTDIVGGDDRGDAARKLGLRLKEMVLSRTRLEQIINEFKLYPADRRRSRLCRRRRRDAQAHRFRVQGRRHLRPRVRRRRAGAGAGGDGRLAEALIGENSRGNAEQAEVTKEFLDARASASRRS